MFAGCFMRTWLHIIFFFSYFTSSSKHRRSCRLHCHWVIAWKIGWTHSNNGTLHLKNIYCKFIWFWKNLRYGELYIFFHFDYRFYKSSSNISFTLLYVRGNNDETLNATTTTNHQVNWAMSYVFNEHIAGLIAFSLWNKISADTLIFFFIYFLILDIFFKVLSRQYQVIILKKNINTYMCINKCIIKLVSVILGENSRTMHS